MAHHSSSSLDPELREAMRQTFAGKDAVAEPVSTELGATGRFPEGKLTPSDEGELRVAIGQKDGKVVIDFGKPVAWVGFTAEQAEDIATTLTEHARECRLRRTTVGG